MHAYGGVYIDLDTECLQPVEPFLEEHDLVFQLEDFGTKSLVNSAIAGAPKLYFWELWQQVIAGRYGSAGFTSHSLSRQKAIELLYACAYYA